MAFPCGVSLAHVLRACSKWKVGFHSSHCRVARHSTLMPSKRTNNSNVQFGRQYHRADLFNSVTALENMSQHINALTRTLYHHDKLGSSTPPPAPGKSLASEDLAGFLEMPYFAKVLVAACYVASYNSRDSDKILFGSESRQRAKKTQPKTAALEISVAVPSVFELERVQYIYIGLLYALGDNQVARIGQCEFERQLVALISFKLLERVSGEEEIDEPRLRFTGTHSFAASMAKKVNINLDDWLRLGT